MLKMDGVAKEKRDRTGGAGGSAHLSDSEERYFGCDPVKPKMKRTVRFASHRGRGW